MISSHTNPFSETQILIVQIKSGNFLSNFLYVIKIDYSTKSSIILIIIFDSLRPFFTKNTKLNSTHGMSNILFEVFLILWIKVKHFIKTYISVFVTTSVNRKCAR